MRSPPMTLIGQSSLEIRKRNWSIHPENTCVQLLVYHPFKFLIVISALIGPRPFKRTRPFGVRPGFWYSGGNGDFARTPFGSAIIDSKRSVFAETNDSPLYHPLHALATVRRRLSGTDRNDSRWKYRMSGVRFETTSAGPSRNGETTKYNRNGRRRPAENRPKEPGTVRRGNYDERKRPSRKERTKTTR